MSIIFGVLYANCIHFVIISGNRRLNAHYIAKERYKTAQLSCSAFYSAAIRLCRSCATRSIAGIVTIESTVERVKISAA